MQNAPRNRYSPPSAPVERPEQKDPLPATVRLGAWLFSISHILFYVLTPRLRVTFKAVAVVDPKEVDPSFPQYALLGTALALALFITPLWLLFKAVKRRSWARVALAVVAPLLLVVFLEGARMYATSDRLQWAIWLTDAALELVALALFFTPTANRWYRASRSNRT